MEVTKATDVTAVKIDKFPYKGTLLDVKGTSVRWLTKNGDDGHGYPEYGLRFFTTRAATSPSTITSIIKPCTYSPGHSNAGGSTPKQTNWRKR